MKAYINGRFLTQPTSGVQRYAREIVTALDSLSTEDDGLQWTLLSPPGADVSFASGLGSVREELAPGAGGHVWDQLALRRRAADGVLVSLCNTGPLLHRRHLVVIHDAAVFRAPGHFSTLYGLGHRTLGRALARTAEIATVSEFSRRELAEVLHLDGARILVAPNGAEHLGRAQPDPGVLARLGVEQRPYFLTVGNQTQNKNIGLAVEAVDRLPKDQPARLVVVGGADSAVFGHKAAMSSDKVVLAGRLSDSELAALYSNAVALVFPSLYEGFGIPPLEAMSYGCPVLASAIPALQEVCGDAADYFDPRAADALADAMIRSLSERPSRASWQARGHRRVQRYSWLDSARLITRRVQAMAA